MRRKDGKSKRRALRRLPQFKYGLRDNPRSEFSRDGLEEFDKPYTVTSLFSGCGGLDLGFLGGFSVLGQSYGRLPFEILSAVDNSEDAVETYRLNISDNVLLADLTKTDLEDLPATDVLMGGFPCQDFSSSGTKAGLEGERGRLYRVLVRYMRKHRPKVVVAENVPHFAKLAGGSIIRTVLKEFEEVGYRFTVWTLNAPDYGLPQSRERIFLIGVRNDLEGCPVIPQPTHQQRHMPIDEALHDLERVEDERVTNQSQYFVATRASAGGGQGDHTNQRGKVAYCIRANSRGRIQFHYSLDRRLTVRECARLQAFPDEFVFPFSTQRNLTLIGNAVPPTLGHHVARSIASYLSGTAVERSCIGLGKSSAGQTPLFQLGAAS